MGGVLGMIWSACMALFHLLGFILIKTRLWIALLVYSLGWLIFPQQYRYNEAVQVLALLVGFILMGFSWSRTRKRQRILEGGE